MLGIIDSPKKVQDIVNVIARCRKGVKQFQQQGGQVEELFPSLPICGKQQQCLHSLPHIPTHVMVFDQLHSGDSGGHRMHTLLCKKLDDGNLSVLLDLYYSIFNTSEFSLQSRYDFSLLHTSSCILKRCFSGRLFPFKVVSWLSVELSKLECASLTTLLNPQDSWVIDDDKQPPLLTPCNNVLLTLFTVDSKSISKRVRSKHKRAPIIKNKNLSVEDCFSIVDHEKDKFSDVDENFYKVLSNSGLTATTTNQSLFQIKFLQLTDTMGVLGEDVRVVLTKDDNKHLIQMVDSCPQCHLSSSNNTLNTTTVQHMCREIAHLSGATTIIASGSFEREFDMESFQEQVVSCTDLTLPIGNDKYFFYSTTQQNMESGGKSMNTLHTESLMALSNMLDNCKRKRDDFRPASENV